jgi:predicted metal-binding membrane protein
MNLVWIAALTLIVLLEKLAPQGKAFGDFTGVLLIAWAVATLLV